MLNKLPDCAGLEAHTCSVCKKWMDEALIELMLFSTELTELRQMKKDFQEIRRFRGDPTAPTYDEQKASREAYEASIGCRTQKH